MVSEGIKFCSHIQILSLILSKTERQSIIVGAKRPGSCVMGTEKPFQSGRLAQYRTIIIEEERARQHNEILISR